MEGNRRLAALKVLREPGILEGAVARKVERLARKIENPQTISKVPVTIAPSRRATDRQIAWRHGGTAVVPWQLENRASFIPDKIEEGYSNEGRSFYNANCATCHGVRGDGKGSRAYFIVPKPRVFIAPAARATFNRPALFAGISGGRAGTDMPAWSKVLSDQEIADVAEYVFQHSSERPR